MAEHKHKNEENEKIIEEFKKEKEATEALKLASESGASEQMEQIKSMQTTNSELEQNIKELAE